MKLAAALPLGINGRCLQISKVIPFVAELASEFVKSGGALRQTPRIVSGQRPSKRSPGRGLCSCRRGWPVCVGSTHAVQEAGGAAREGRQTLPAGDALPSESEGRSFSHICPWALANTQRPQTCPFPEQPQRPGREAAHDPASESPGRMAPASVLPRGLAPAGAGRPPAALPSRADARHQRASRFQVAPTPLPDLPTLLDRAARAAAIRRRPGPPKHPHVRVPCPGRCIRIVISESRFRDSPPWPARRG